MTDAPVYPTPGSEIPDQPGYVVGECGHRVAGSEWRAGFRTCERCPKWDDDGGCDGCLCCSYGRCVGPNSECPTDSLGDSVCPCTCD